MTRVAVLVASLVTATLLLALAPAHAEHWDEVQLALGMKQFDVAWHHPHPPGYVLFVLAGRAVGALTRVMLPGRLLSIAAAITWLVVVASSLRASLDRRLRAALIALVPPIIVLSPTLLTHASTGRTYWVEATCWVAILVLCTRRTFRPALLGALVGIGGGFRPTVLLWGLVALVIVAAFRRPPRRALVAMTAAVVITTASWIAALALLSGGLARYVRVVTPLLRDNVGSKSALRVGVREVLGTRLPLMLESVWTALGPLLLATALLLVVRARSRALRELDALLLGSALAFLFYLAVIYDSDGYSLSYVLPLLTWTILAGARVLDTRRARAALPLVVASLAVFTILPGGVATETSIPATRARMTAAIDARLAAIRSLPAESTLVVTGVERLTGWSFRLLMFEAPTLPVMQVVHDPYFPELDAAHPYMLARDHRLSRVADGVDLASLTPQPLRYVVLADSKDAPLRVHPSCLLRARALVTSRGERLPMLEVGPSLHVRAQQQKLVCEAHAH